MLHNARYQREREAAAQRLGLTGSEVSVGKGIEIIGGEITEKKEGLVTLQEISVSLQAESSACKKMISGVEEQLRNIYAAEKEQEKAKEIANAIRSDFSLLYQSDAGCKAINAQSRFLYDQAASPAVLHSDKVIAEYKKVFGDEIFAKGNKNIKYIIQSHCSQLTSLIHKAAEAWYTPDNKNITTHRGQGMTREGMAILIREFRNNRDTVYQTGQFFSTSADKTVAAHFAEKSPDVVKVIFSIKGNSGRTLAVSDGFCFVNREREILYSPLARFKINRIMQERSGIYHIQLAETDRRHPSRLLPY